jgi:hypothetical protein
MLPAVLACGVAAVLSHDSAAALWRLTAGVVGPHHVLRSGPRRRGRAGLRLHGTSSLQPPEVTTFRGVPVTSLPRTLLDLAATGPSARLELAVDDARARRLVTEEALAAASGRGALRCARGGTGLHPRAAARATDERPGRRPRGRRFVGRGAARGRGRRHGPHSGRRGCDDPAE